MTVMKTAKIFLYTVLIIFIVFVLVELCVNMLAFRYLIPIKNAMSYGYISGRTSAAVVPLNKYNERYLAQIMLPFELIMYKYNNPSLKLSYNSITKLYGYKDKKGKTVIEEKFSDAEDFYRNYAIAAVEKDGKLLYGSIDKHGNWIIKPKYSHICSLSDYYTRACIDTDHCGVINIWGDEMTAMTYHVTKITPANEDFVQFFCSIHTDNKKDGSYCF